MSDNTAINRKFISTVLTFFADLAEESGEDADVIMGLRKIARDLIDEDCHGLFMTLAQAHMVVGFLDLATETTIAVAQSVARVTQAAERNEGAMQS